MGAIDGSKSLSESLSGILRQLGGMFLNKGIGSFKKADGTGGSGLLGMFANGGRPPVGRPSIVGERGPELFVPNTSGTIIPNGKFGGGATNVVVNVDAKGTSAFWRQWLSQAAWWIDWSGGSGRIGETATTWRLAGSLMATFPDFDPAPGMTKQSATKSAFYRFWQRLQPACDVWDQYQPKGL